MVVAHIDPTSRTGTIVLRPNRSLALQGNLIVFAVMVVLSAGLTTVFTILGAWPVLPFYLLELGVLAGGIAIAVVRMRIQEVITVSAYRVLVEKGASTPSRRWSFHRLFAQFAVAGPRGHRPASIHLRSAGTEVELGRFLNQEDKTALLRHLRHLTASPISPDTSNGAPPA